MKLNEIAKQIDAHLKRFEADPVINAKRMGFQPFWQCGCGVSGSWIFVVYVGYQGHTSLRKADAERYLEWLDAGNVGRHWNAFNEFRALRSRG